uniref:acetyl-CoA hydrolase/transferase family protein n=1 Tax=Diaphorobacter sp. TaxID=1934310 RepID=UPI00258678B4
VSPPDAQGRYSLGLVQEYLPAAIERARVVIAEVHPDVPWTHGGLHLQTSDFALLIDAEHPPLDQSRSAPGPVEQAIARHVAGWVEDGATLQLGIGNLPDAVLAALHGHRDLGLHSGAVGDGIAALAEAGVLTNARKSLDTGVGIGGILMGGERLRRWAHRNPQIELRGTDYTHDPEVLAASHKLAAINAAIEVDLTGQINAEVAAGCYVGAVGGAVDFLRGAARSRGGLPIVALPATAKGASRIVAWLTGPVSTPRSDAGLIVTEHGVADLRGQPLSRRVRRLIDIAAPEHRADLERQAHDTLRRCGAVFQI